MQKLTYTVSLTGAAGNIASSLIYQLLKPGVFSTQPYKVILKLVDLKETHDILCGRIMEIEDSFFETFERAEVHEDSEEAFMDADCVILAGARPRTIGMERQDLLKINAKVIQYQARLVNKVAKPDTKILVVGNPSNTNAVLFADAAPNIPKTNITSLSMLDFDRAVALLAKETHVNSREIKNIKVFGNHSKTMYVDATSAFIESTINGSVVQKPLHELVSKEFLETDLQKIVQNRGAQIISALGHSACYSAAFAIIRHLKCWYVGSENLIAVGIFVDEFMECGTELCITLPVYSKDGRFIIDNKLLDGLDDTAIKKIKVSVKELVFEKNMAFDVVKD